MGPFIDASHPQIAAGDVALDDGAGGKVEVDFKELFRLRVLMLLEQHLPDLTTKVILIPSLDDVHHDDYVFPQPALPIRRITTEQVQRDEMLAEVSGRDGGRAGREGGRGGKGGREGGREGERIEYT
jgi:hypothetical protein